MIVNGTAHPLIDTVVSVGKESACIQSSCFMALVQCSIQAKIFVPVHTGLNSLKNAVTPPNIGTTEA